MQMDIFNYMCLVVNLEKTTELKATLQTLTVYKVLNRDKEARILSSPYRAALYGEVFQYQPGEIVSSRGSVELTEWEQRKVVRPYVTVIEDGLHVCLTREEAEGIVEQLFICLNKCTWLVGSHPALDLVVVELQVNTSDIVGVGIFGDYNSDSNRAVVAAHTDKEAVVMKATLTQEEFDSAFLRENEHTD